MTDLAAAKQALLEEVATPKVEALIEAMFLAATSDGDFAASEAGKFAATLEAITEKRLDAASIDRRVASLAQLLRKEGRPARLGAVAARLTTPTARETALILAAVITKADGFFHAGENDLLADLAEALGVEQGRAVDLVERIHKGT